MKYPYCGVQYDATHFSPTTTTSVITRARQSANYLDTVYYIYIYLSHFLHI